MKTIMLLFSLGILIPTIASGQTLKAINNGYQLGSKRYMNEDQISLLFKNYPEALASYKESKYNSDKVGAVLIETLVLGSVTAGVFYGVSASSPSSVSVLPLFYTLLYIVPIVGVQLFRILNYSSRAVYTRRLAADIYNEQAYGWKNEAPSLKLGMGQYGVGLVLSF